MNTRRWRITVITCAVLCLAPTVVPASEPPANRHSARLGGNASLSPTGELLQFVAGGHVLGFAAGEVHVATGSHALRTEFVGAAGVSPSAEGAGAAEAAKAAPLARVRYEGLWDGVSLAYDATADGILRSTWTVAPGADPGRIRLRYNVPVTLDADGGMRFLFARGWMRESAPVAWQEVGGRRVPVEVTFREISEREVGFTLGAYDRARTLWIDPTLQWNTFLGQSATDEGRGIAVDGSGNTYVTGFSSWTWGSPVRPQSGDYDAFVAKLDSSGALQWNTFLGSSSTDEGYGIAVDGGGSVYVTGRSYLTWGSPVRPHSGEYDAFVAQLDSSGALRWNTFLGSSARDEGYGIAVDGSGNTYVTGWSRSPWGSPVGPPSGDYAAFVAKMNSSGVLRWHTFLDSLEIDKGYGIAVDGSGNAYVTGKSGATWGSPVRPPAGNTDAFVAKLNSSGTLQWNTFLGSSFTDHLGIAVDGSGNTYVTGSSYGTWGSPVRPYSDLIDTFVAKLDSSGVLQWNTFLGSSADDYGYGIAVDGGGNTYVTGSSKATWGSPVHPFTVSVNYTDAFVTKLNSSGTLQWNTFLGSSNDDQGYGIAVDGSGNTFVTGSSLWTWGSPVRPRSGGATSNDAFVAKLINAPPVLVAGDQAVNEAELLAFLITGSDDGDPLTFGSTALPAGATFDTTTGAFSWTLGYSQAGAYPITFTVSDGQYSDSKTITITVNDTNRAPLAVDDATATPMNTAKQIAVLQNDSDPDGDVMTVSAVTQGAHGTVTSDANTVTYTPAAGYVGPDSFTYTVSDGRGGTALGSVTVATDGAAPVVVIATPAADAVLNVVPEIAGVAVDAAPTSGLAVVEVMVKDSVSGEHLQLAPAAGWVAQEHWNTATGTASWTVDTSAASWTFGRRYLVTARVFDAAGNSSTAVVSFTYSSGSEAYTQITIMPSSQSILQNETIDVTGALSERANEDIDLSGRRILLRVTPPPLGAVVTHETFTRTNKGDYLFTNIGNCTDKGCFTDKGVYRLQVEFEGKAGLLQPATSAVETLLVGNTAGYAVIVEGKVPDDPDGLKSHHKTTRRVYQALLERDFDPLNIFFFHHTVGEQGVGPPSKDAVAQVLTTQIKTKMNAVPGPLWVVLVDHGNPGKFYLGTDWIAPEDLDAWLVALESGLDDAAKREKRIIVVGSCYSGSFIETLKRAPVRDTGDNLVDAGRLVVASAAADEESYKGSIDPDDSVRDGEFFVEELFKELVKGVDLKRAFTRATERTESFTSQGGGSPNSGGGKWDDGAVQHPLLEDDGEWAGSNALSDGEGDGVEAAGIRLGVGQTSSAANPAELVRVTETLHLPSGQTQALLWAKEDVEGAADAVWIEVKRPDTVLAARGGTGQLEWSQASSKFFLLRGEGRMERVYGTDCQTVGCLDIPGRYDVYYYSRNKNTLEISEMRHSVIYKDKDGNNRPPPAVLSTPADGAQTKTVLLLDWEDVDDPDTDPVSYTVSVARDAGFADLVHVQEGLTESEAMIGLDAGLVDGQTYYWKVVPTDPRGAEPASAPTVWSFTPLNETNPVLPGYLKGCVTNAATGAAVQSPAVIPSRGSVLVNRNCYSMFTTPGSVTLSVTANGYRGASVSAMVTSGVSTRRNVPMTPVQHTLTVLKTGTGTGLVSGGGTYYYGTIHRISALPDSGSVFYGWSGDCAGTASLLSVLVDRNKTCTATFTLIPQGNRPPVFAPIGNRRVNETRTLSFRLIATDADGDTLRYSSSTLPAGAALDRTTGVFRWIPAHNQSGVYTVTFKVSDGFVIDSETVTITVLNQVLFYDDFAHGTSTGDPDWKSVLGSWGVTGTAKLYTSDPRRALNLALTRKVANIYSSGVVTFKAYLLKPTRGTANATLLFAYKGTSLFRYVELLPGKVAIGQLGTLGGQTARRKEFPTTLVQPARWLAVRVTLATNGTVTVAVGTKVVATYKFTTKVSGNVGVRANTAKSMLDNFMVQSALALQ